MPAEELRAITGLRAWGWLTVVLGTDHRMMIYFCVFILKAGRGIRSIYTALGQENRGRVPVQGLLSSL